MQADVRRFKNGAHKGIAPGPWLPVPPNSSPEEAPRDTKPTVGGGGGSPAFSGGGFPRSRHTLSCRDPSSVKCCSAQLSL